MPPKAVKILDLIENGVRYSSKYWDDAVRSAQKATTTTPGLRVPLNSIQRQGYLNLQRAQNNYKYFRDPKLARFDFEQIAPLSTFQSFLPKGQVGDPFELKQFYPKGKELGLPSHEIKTQMDLRIRDLFNNMYRVNTPMIFKMGGLLNE